MDGVAGYEEHGNSQRGISRRLMGPGLAHSIAPTEDHWIPKKSFSAFCKGF
jgi:hypothetical protein